MAYMLAKNKEMMFDFFALLHALQYAGRYGEICPRPDMGINAKVSDAYYRLHNINCTLNRNLQLFFTHRRDQEITFFDWLFISGVDTYLSSDDLIGAIVKIDPHKMGRQILRFYDPYNHFDDKFYNGILQSYDLYMNYIDGLMIPSDIRWEIVSFINRPTDMLDKLKCYIEVMFQEFLAEYSNLKEQRATLNVDLMGYIKNGSLHSAIAEKEISENEKMGNAPQEAGLHNNEIKIVGLLFAPNKIYKVKTGQNIYYCVGIGYMEYYSHFLIAHTEEQEFRNLFRAFTDPIRVGIIDILHEKECYNGEISKLLSIPMSSLTHHLEILNGCRFVIKRALGKRTYYKLNKGQFLKAAKMLREYVE